MRGKDGSACRIADQLRRDCGEGAESGVERGVEVKVGHWCGVWGKNALKGATVLDSYCWDTQKPRRPSVGWDPAPPTI